MKKNHIASVSSLTNLLDFLEVDKEKQDAVMNVLVYYTEFVRTGEKVSLQQMADYCDLKPSELALFLPFLLPLDLHEEEAMSVGRDVSVVKFLDGEFYAHEDVPKEVRDRLRDLLIFGSIQRIEAQLFLVYTYPTSANCVDSAEELAESFGVSTGSAVSALLKVSNALKGEEPFGKHYA